MSILNITRRNVSRCVLLASLLACVNLSAQVQVEARADVEKGKIEKLLSPIVDGNTNLKRFNPKDWLEIEFQLEIDAKASNGADPLFIDQLDFDFYVAVENKKPTRQNDAKRLLLKKTLSYVNIPVKEKIYVSVYLSPSSLKRLTGGDRADASIISAQAVQVKLNGQIIGGSTTLGDMKKNGVMAKAWWQDLGKELMSYEAIPLLSKDETPFAALWYDRYAELKKDAK